MSDPNSSERERRLEEALADYLLAAEAGTPIDRDELLGRHPDLADELKAFFSNHDLLKSRRAPPPTLDDTPQPEPSDAPTAEFGKSAPKVGPGDHLRYFGDYEILEEIARGGMGVVYKARQVSLNRVVAVKMILAGKLASQSDVDRFYAEAEAAASLRHPNIVAIHEVDEHNDQHYFSMDYVDGKSLADLVRSGPLPAKRAAAYVKSVAEAIQYAHDRKILHRDLKPSNVLIDAFDRPRITDFGLAKRMGADSRLTASGSILGTPSYMPPEQASGRIDDLKPSCDVYSLGAVLYELLTGQAPFRAEHPLDTVMQVLSAEPVSPRLRRPDVPRDLETICLKCLQKDPANRYGSAQELAADLGRYLNHEPVRARPRSFPSQCWHWMRDIPVVAALIGRRVANPTPVHRFAQWACMAVVILAVLTTVVVLQKPSVEKPFPARLRIATGKHLGEYRLFGETFGQLFERRNGVPFDLVATEGSGENRSLVLADDAELALLQASSVSEDDLAVVTPLYEEYVYVVVRTEGGIDRMKDLNGKQVVVGDPGSGMKLSARRLCQRLEVVPVFIEASVSQLKERPDWDAAIVTTGSHSPMLKDLASDERFKLHPLYAFEVQDLERDPVFRPYTIKAGSLVSVSGGVEQVPPHDVPTVRTMTYLAVRDTANGEFVTSVLSTLFGDVGLAASFDLIPRHEAAAWPALPLHPAARRFLLEADERGPELGDSGNLVSH